MTRHAWVFPGQGSQELGMGRSFYDAFPIAKQTFDEVDEALGMYLSKIIFGDDAALLTRTEYAQPAIMVTSMAMVRTLEQEAGIRVASRAMCVAGHSLGEYTALCASGAMSLGDTARLLRVRGRAMQDAVPVGVGTMAAILGLELEQVEALLKNIQNMGIVEIANDNAPGQIVLSGAREAVEHAIQQAKDAGAKRAIELNVSAPFHCSLIAAAAEVMREALASITIHAPCVPLIANITADVARDPNVIRELLVQQVTGRVRWRESVQRMAVQGVEHMLEIGHGKVLSGLNKRIHKDMGCSNLSSPEDIDAFIAMPA
ncbi:MAG: [acyl-carrier-protein] S-malonyltransferase [Alphaproteobacteria bacterium]|nr:MAG: [acyl-carrier-protein] S-malonyltransferase [Alphaproteobacteria bacterium]TAF15941.1 MAG: [acyl-carrier-protein] S-malonyltransferase [Alphaproteobacteria bacterium]TAF41942.1 MAG: [acyl-carrier-protein] S-malonyltransferase [Alphaproteobacteria bacterium]TAF76755.1 MAG: [acyl-carrier-protein] S-malonyltransferase [Alphaproteobacteria bacterium]